MSARGPTGRLAPTPSGHLHLGNALAFGAAWLSARNARGRLLLRIEDLDRGRAREEIAAAQRDDLAWLGIDWDEEVAPQSARRYSLESIPVYRCDCSRAARLAGGCRCREAAPGVITTGAWRFRTPPGAVGFVDRACGAQRLVPDEDPILVREDGEAAYPLAVVVDDARDGVTEVVRGGDLLEATATQLRLLEALALPAPSYLHVPVLLGEDGKKLSKSHASTELRALRAAGWTPLRVWETLLPVLGLPPGPLADARLDPARIPPGPHIVDHAGRVRT
jgi:glutamyl/glutaminyl-tRNA synthetase